MKFVMKFWNAMGHSLFYEDGESQKTRRILRVVFFLYLLVLMKVIVFKYPLSEGAVAGDTSMASPNIYSLRNR